VQQVIVTAAQMRAASRLDADAARLLRLWLRQSTQNLVRAAACAAGASAGAAVVALLLPAGHPKLAQWATIGGLLAGDLAGSTFVAQVTAAWVAGAE
jgi:hypothetical protein